MKLLLSVVVFLVCVVCKSNTTNVALSASFADVSAAYAASSAGDVVKIPVGVGYWTNLIHIIPTKRVSFIGSGMTNGTVLYNNIASPITAFPEFFFITNSISSPDSGLPIRISSMEFRRGTTGGVAAARSVIAIDCKSPLIRLDHLNFNNVNTRPLSTFDVGTNIFAGVMDHCTSYNPNNSGGMFFDGGTYGNEAWTKPVPFGSTNGFFFIEDCIFTNGVNRAMTDGRAGTYYCVRFNTNYNVSYENHEMFGRKRSARGQLIHNNYFWAAVTSENATVCRSGTYYIYSNTVAGAVPGIMRFLVSRYDSQDVPWGEASGTNVWDLNDPVNYASGTHTGTNHSTVLVDTNVFWGTNNYWLSKSIINLDYPTVQWTNQINAGNISASTSNTISVSAPANSGSQLYWTNGNRYTIRRVISIFDQPGIGAGDMVVTTSDTVPGTNQTTGLPGWTHNVLDPCYVWANTGTSPGTNVAGAGLYYTITQGSNWIYGIPPGYVDNVPHPHPFAVYLDGQSGPGITDGGSTGYPTIAGIANQTIIQDTATGTLNVTLGSGVTNVNNYTVTTASTLTTLVPNTGTNYVFGGSGANRTLVIYPEPGQYGITLITLTVTDEVGHTGGTQFQLTVTQTPSQPPTITAIADITTTVGHIGGPSSFTIGDPVTPAANLTLTGVSSNHGVLLDSFIFFGGSDSNRTVAVIPISDGTTTVTVTVQDDAARMASTNFLVTVHGNTTTLLDRKQRRTLVIQRQ